MISRTGASRLVGQARDHQGGKGIQFLATLILTSEITQTQTLAINLQRDGLRLGLTGQFMIKAGWAFNFLDILEKLENISRNLTPCN